jgi:hypothetical protein
MYIELHLIFNMLHGMMGLVTCDSSQPAHTLCHCARDSHLPCLDLSFSKQTVAILLPVGWLTAVRTVLYSLGNDRKYLVWEHYDCRHKHLDLQSL